MTRPVNPKFNYMLQFLAATPSYSGTKEINPKSKLSGWICRVDVQGEQLQSGSPNLGKTNILDVESHDPKTLGGTSAAGNCPEKKIEFQNEKSS